MCSIKVVDHKYCVLFQIVKPLYLRLIYLEASVKKYRNEQVEQNKLALEFEDIWWQV